MTDQCDSCGYTGEVEEYGPYCGEIGRRKRFCAVCTNTFVSMIVTDPKALRDPAYFYRSLALATNMILDAVRSMEERMLRFVNSQGETR